MLKLLPIYNVNKKIIKFQNYLLVEGFDSHKIIKGFDFPIAPSNTTALAS